MLPSVSYWVGITRDDNTVPFAFVDGVTIPQTATNSPYAHWSSQTSTLAYDALKTSWNCIQVSVHPPMCVCGGGRRERTAHTRTAPHCTAPHWPLVSPPIVAATCPGIAPHAARRTPRRRRGRTWRTSSTLATRRPLSRSTGSITTTAPMPCLAGSRRTAPRCSSMCARCLPAPSPACRRPRRRRRRRCRRRRRRRRSPRSVSGCLCRCLGLCLRLALSRPAAARLLQPPPPPPLHLHASPRRRPPGAPAATRNIFCEPVSGLCFNLTTTVRSFDDASAACAAMTGRLVTHTTAAKQLMVEQVGGGGSGGLDPWHCGPCARCWVAGRVGMPDTATGAAAPQLG
jgi:hypothetical protein